MERWQLQQLQSLPLEIKIQKSKLRIREWYEHFEGEVYVSFSGGKDSTVLLDLVRSMYPDVPAVFVNTGLEYPEIIEFVKTIENVTWLNPKIHFKDVIEKYGYPVISKEVSEAVWGAREGYPSMIKKLTDKQRKFNCTKYKHLLNTNFKISHKCCDIMKKNPVKLYENQTDKKPIVGTMAYESQQRQSAWIKSGCNSFETKRPMSLPISFWLERDIWDYLRVHNIPYSKIYDMGYKRTGCMFCIFGCHLEKEPKRFQRMEKTHPKLHDYCINKLGLKEVLEHLNIPYTSNQISMF